MSRTLRHFIREALMDVAIGSYRFKIDAMLIGDAEYNATIAKYPATKPIFMNIEQAFEQARQNRVSYLTSDFEARLAKLLEYHKITGIKKEKIRDAMLSAVSSAKLYVQRYPDDVMSQLEPLDREWIFDPSSKSWGKIAASTRYSKLSISAFAHEGNIFCPPPKLFFNRAKELIAAVKSFNDENTVDLFEHELEHVETEAVVKLSTTDTANPAVLSYDIVLSMLLSPEEITLDKMQTFVDDVPALLFTVSDDDDDANTTATCVYLAILAYAITRGKNQKYFDNAIDIASDNNLKQDYWENAKTIAVDNASPDHLRTSMLFLREALSGALMNQTDKFQIMKDVEKFMKAQKRNKDQIRRSLSLLAITDVSKYNDLLLVAAADSSTTRNQA